VHGSRLDPHRFWLRFQRYPYLLAKGVTFLLIAAGLWWVLSTIEDVLFPILAAMMLAYLLDPAVDWFEVRGFSRTVGIALFLGAGITFAVLFLLVLYPTVDHIIGRVSAGLPALVGLLRERAVPWAESYGLLDTGGLLQRLQDQLPGLLRGLTGALTKAWTRTGAVASSLLNVVLVPILTFYFLRDFDRMRTAAADYLPAHNREWLLVRIARMDKVVGAWFRGQLEVALILAMMYAIGLGVTFGMSGSGVTSGISIGVLAGLLNVIPYFGFLVGFVLSVLLALLDWTGWGGLIGVLLTFGVVQALEGYVVTPRIVGNKVGLSPVVVIVALLLGGELMGLLGVLLALPLAGISRVLLPDLVDAYKASDLFQGESPPAED